MRLNILEAFLSWSFLSIISSLFLSMADKDAFLSAVEKTRSRKKSKQALAENLEKRHLNEKKTDLAS